MTTSKDLPKSSATISIMWGFGDAGGGDDVDDDDELGVVESPPDTSDAATSTSKIIVPVERQSN